MKNVTTSKRGLNPFLEVPMRMTIGALASALVLAAGASAMLAAPGQTQQPGQMTQARVWIENRGHAEALPVDLQESSLRVPLNVRVMNGEGPYSADPVNVRVVRQPRVWLYQTVVVKRDQNLATALSALGGAGWETTGIALEGTDGTTTLLLKRLR
jgi:hypothetical protein